MTQHNGHLAIAPIDSLQFCKDWDQVAKVVHSIAVEQGFWTEGKARHPTHPIALGTSEFGEALNAWREKKPDKNLPHRSGFEVQLADVLGILLDMQEGYGLDLVGALADKMEFNRSRGHLHGKRY